MSEQCARLGVLVTFGMVERSVDGPLYNAGVLIGPQGLVGAYRKIHLPFMGADRYLTAGDRLEGPFVTEQGTLGMQICYDLRFPETMRALALRGAQVVLVPTALPATATIFPEVLNRARAVENRVYVVSANHRGEEGGSTYMGRSQIVGPDGSVMADAGSSEETILYAEVDLAEADRKKLVFQPGEYELDLFGARRPDLYKDLTQRDEA
jgi:predicted amidohydrolase